MLTVRDGHGTPLSDVSPRPGPTRNSLILIGVARPGALLSYYFGCCGRRITISFNAWHTDGRINTRWCQHGRQWLVELTSPVPLAWLETPAAAGIAPAMRTLPVERFVTSNLPDRESAYVVPTQVAAPAQR